MINLSEFHGKEDLKEMIDLIRKVRTPKCWLDYPNQVDLHEILSLPEIQQNTRLWKTGQGELIAFMMVDLNDNLLFEVQDNGYSSQIKKEIMEWADKLVRKKNKSQNLDAVCRSDDLCRIRFLDENGFIKQSERTINLERDLSDPIPQPIFPQGFSVRLLGGESEVKEYVNLHQDAFGTRQMSIDVRLSIMRTPEYRPDLDFVLAAPDGSLAGFLVCQIIQTEGFGMKKAIGYTDPMGIHPNYQKKGLAAPLLLFGLTKLREKNMDTARISTLDTNRAMLQTALSAGFKIVSEKLWWSKQLF